jgi:23S rRNA-intervening sequence protein
MEKDNVIQVKSFAFAIRVVNLYKYLSSEKKEYVLSKQLMRAGTSIGAKGQVKNGDYLSLGTYLLDKTFECNRLSQ